MTFPQTIDPQQENKETPFGEDLLALHAASVYGFKAETSSGLVVGYHGNVPLAVADGTYTCTASTTNYVVAHRSTGAVSVSTATTNWNDTATYGRVRKHTTNGSGVTATEDWRSQPDGIFDHGAAGTTAAGTSIADAGGYFTGTDVEAALQELGASLAGSVSNVPAQRFTIELANTTDSDPGAGLVKFDNATPASATNIYVDDSTSDGVDLSTYFASFGATGFLKIQSALDAGEWAIFKWTATTDGTGYWKFAVTPQASKGTLDDADAVLIEFDSDATGGAGGTELKGLTFTSDTGSTADSDPGAGLFKWDNATQGSATKLFFDNATLDSITITAFFATLSANGTVFIQQGDDATRWQLWEIDTATADTGYYDLAVTLLAKSTADIADAKTCYCSFTKGPGTGGSTQGLHDMPLGAASWYQSYANGATSAQSAGAANQPDAVVWQFDPTTAQSIWTVIEMPKSWDEGTITFHLKWMHAATATNFGVVFQLRAVAMGDGDAWAATFGTAQTVTDTGGTTLTTYSTPESSAITIAGTPQARDLVYLELMRLPSDGSDTLAVAAQVTSVTVQYSTNADTDA